MTFLGLNQPPIFYSDTLANSHDDQYYSDPDMFLYSSLVKEPHPLLLAHFPVYRVNIYSNERPPWSKLCVTKQCTRGVQEVQPQPPCITEVRNLCVLYFIARQLCIDGHS